MSTRRQALGSTALLLAGGIGGWRLKPSAPTEASRLWRHQTEPQAPPVTVTTRSGLRIHAIQTGFVAVKAAHRSFRGPAGMGMPAIALDPRWTDWMPIYAWVVEHPEGIIVIDTGESSRTVDPAYFACDPVTAFIYRSFLRFAVGPADEIGAQMVRLGLSTADVRTVVQTHLHSDHADGMGSFPGAEFLLSPIDYPNAPGALRCRYPAWLKPTLVRWQSRPLYNFAQSYQITQAGDVHIVATPGHSTGHQSVLLQDSDCIYFFAGDTSFDEKQLQQGIVGGVSADPTAARATLTAIRALAAQQPIVYLPSHDPASAVRLAKRQTTQVAAAHRDGKALQGQG